MKRLLLAFAFIPLLAHAQWQQVGNTLQRTSDGFKYRTALGSPGFVYWYQKYQVDSLISKYGYLFTGTTGQYTDGTGHYQTFPSFQAPLTFNNGLTNTSGTVQLGGPLLSNTTIDLEGNIFSLNDAPSASFLAFYGGLFPSVQWSILNGGGANTRAFAMGSTGIELQSNNNNTHQGSLLYLYGTRLILEYTQPTSGQTQSIGFTGSTGSSSMLITDNINNKGMVYNASYDVAGITDSLWISDYGAVVKAVKVARNAANFGLTTTLADVGHYALPATGDQTIRAGAWLNVKSVTTTDSVTVTVTWTDNHNISQTKTFWAHGVPNSGNIGTVADYSFYPMDFRALSGTTIQVAATVSGSGTILYEVGCTIQKLIGDGGL